MIDLLLLFAIITWTLIGAIVIALAAGPTARWVKRHRALGLIAAFAIWVALMMAAQAYH